MKALGASAVVCLALSVSPAWAQAATPLTGAEIATLISGNTVTGTMAAGGPYTEFYLPDGTLRGSNYDGNWSVEGDTLCFVYDATTPKQCWGATITSAGEVLWIKNGIVDGNGIVASGNPSNL